MLVGDRFGSTVGRGRSGNSGGAVGPNSQSCSAASLGTADAGERTSDGHCPECLQYAFGRWLLLLLRKQIRRQLLSANRRRDGGESGRTRVLTRQPSRFALQCL